MTNTNSTTTLATLPSLRDAATQLLAAERALDASLFGGETAERLARAQYAYALEIYTIVRDREVF